MEFEESKRAIAAIYYKNNIEIAGTGFLIADRYLMTCAHVVAEVIGPSNNYIGKSIVVRFFNQSRSYSAKVVDYHYEETKNASDAAILHLESVRYLFDGLPPFTPLDQFSGAELKGFGYPENLESGLNLDASTKGEVDGGWVQIQPSTSISVGVEGGFSGSPIWSDRQNAWVGMIVAFIDSKEKKDEKIGFIIPQQKLKNTLKVLDWHPLLLVLKEYEQDFAVPQFVYEIVRPDIWNHPQHLDLRSILIDLCNMPSEGENFSRLEAFVAVLLNHADVRVETKVDLGIWIGKYCSQDEIAALRKTMGDHEEEVAYKRTALAHERLLISLQPGKSKDSDTFQIKAWLIRNIKIYDADKPGPEVVLLNLDYFSDYVEDDEQTYDFAEGYLDRHLPAIMANYLDQVEEKGIDSEALVIEVFLPYTHVNEPIELCSIPNPGGFGTSQKYLGIIKNCSKVHLRIQNRLEQPRLKRVWKKKWQNLQLIQETENGTNCFIEAGIDPDLENGLKSDTVFGLKICHQPNCTQQGEIGSLLASGVPTALWIRSLEPNSPMCSLIDEEILDKPLIDIPERVQHFRRQVTEHPDEITDKKSLELGHLISFIWENPQIIPPQITYQNENLS